MSGALRHRGLLMAAGAAGGNVDSFNTDTTSNYTQSADHVGSWTCTGGQMVSLTSSAGSQSVFTFNAFSAADCFVEADIQYATDSGLVARYIDNNNYYLCTICDDSGDNPSANLRLFKRIGGSFTQLGTSVNVTWTRGTMKTVKLECVDDSIAVYLNDVLQISVTDSSLTSPGKIGMRGNGASSLSNTNKFDELRWG